METWQISAIEVWGNARDGFEINREISTSDTFTAPAECDARTLLKLLRGALGHRRDARGYEIDVDGSEGYFQANRARNGEPAYVARRID